MRNVSVFLLLCISLASCEPEKEMSNSVPISHFDYKVPSYHWKNKIQPRFDLFEIESSLGLEPEVFFRTGYALADFNSDGYIDIMAQKYIQGTTDIEFYFLLNNGDDTFYIDNSFFNSNFSSRLGARKTIVGDFNNDQRPDVVRISGGHDVLDRSNITLSQPNGEYIISELQEVPESEYHGFASGDIDNDGDLDLFFGSPAQGFAYNNGDGSFVWRYSCDVFLNCPDGLPRENVGTVEIYDLNNDGNLDLILGGEYNRHINQGTTYLNAPTIFWGNGSGVYDFNNKTEVFNLGDIPSIGFGVTGNTDDFVFGDVDGDGLDEIILLFINLNGDQGNHFLEIYVPNQDYEFSNQTNALIPQNIIHGAVWIQLRDIDDNGLIDIVEPEPVTGNGNSIRFQWNGSQFIKLQ